MGLADKKAGRPACGTVLITVCDTSAVAGGRCDSLFLTWYTAVTWRYIVYSASFLTLALDILASWAGSDRRGTASFYILVKSTIVMELFETHADNHHLPLDHRSEPAPVRITRDSHCGTAYLH